MIWLISLLCVLILGALLLRRVAQWEARRAALPAGDLLYSDTGRPVGRMAPVTVNLQGLKQEKPLISPTFALVGRPDYIIETDDGIIPIEVKSSACPANGRPYDSHVAQVSAYCLLVEDALKTQVPYGIIRYRDCELRIDYTDEMRAEVIALLDEIRAARLADEVHRSHDEARRCAGCCMREICEESLA